MAVSNEIDFHTKVHASIGIPSTEYKLTGRRKLKRRMKIEKMHVSEWAHSYINLKARTIVTTVYINFQKSSLSITDYHRLVNLASRGIQQFWSRHIKIDGELFSVIIVVKGRVNRAVDVDLVLETGIQYARSHNSGIIDASFIYNKGFYRGMNSNADRDFMLVAAHEFGHSVLQYFGGADLSWTHKNSTNKYLQNIKETTPGYPSSGEIDIMKYYELKKECC